MYIQDLQTKCLASLETISKFSLKDMYGNIESGYEVV